MAKMNLWNTKNLPMPPINTYKPDDAKIDIKHLSNVFREGKDFFGNEHYMFTEYKILSIIVYRLKQKCRSAKDFKALEKVHKALHNYFETNILKDLENFMNLIPDMHTDETYLPNKNMVDYILVRLQGITKLLERMVETCKATASLLDTRIHIGHLWQIAFIAFSLVSRIFILAKHSTKFVCKLYNKLFPFSHLLKNEGRNWLPVNYVLPPDLQKWINVEWLYIDEDLQIIEPSELPNITQFFDLVDDDDDIQFCEEYIMIDDDEDIIKEFKKLEDIKDSIQKMRGFDMDEDIGEAIVVDESVLLENEVQQIDTPSNNQDIRISGNSIPTEMKESDVDFGEVIEISDSRIEKSDKNGIINIDNSLSSLKEYHRGINDIIELSDTSQIINEDVDSFNNNWNKMNYLPTSTPLRNVSQTSSNSINVNDEVITLLDSPITSPITNRNGVKGKGLQKKKKNKSAVNKSTGKKKVRRRRKEKNKSVLCKLSTTNGINISNQSFGECSNNNNYTKFIRKANSTISPTRNRNWFADGTAETVISISDSSTLHENVNKSTTKKKKLKPKKNRNAKKNISESFNNDGTNINASNSDTLSNTLVIDLCGKRKRKKIKQNVRNSKNNNSNEALWNTENSSYIHSPSKKIKLEAVDESSDKKVIVESKPNEALWNMDNSSYIHSPSKKIKLEDVDESTDEKVQILRSRVVTKLPKVKCEIKKEIVESEQSHLSKEYRNFLKRLQKENENKKRAELGVNNNKGKKNKKKTKGLKNSVIWTQQTL